jgi:hypothetical protein
VPLLSTERLAALRLPGTVRLGSPAVEPVGRLGTGIDALDELLEGGLPRGHLSEIVGAVSSGGTALLWALLAATTRRGEVAAVVDLPDALHPRALRTAGADLGRVLWVRPPSLPVGLKCTELIAGAGGFGLVVLDLSLPGIQRLPLHVWPRLGGIARRTGTALAVLARQRVAGSFATLSVALTLRQARWERNLFAGWVVRAVFVRNRLGRSAISCQLSAVSDQLSAISTAEG